MLKEVPQLEFLGIMHVYAATQAAWVVLVPWRGGVWLGSQVSKRNKLHMKGAT